MSTKPKTKTAKPNPQTGNSNGGGNRPVMTMNVGRIRAAVWANKSDDGRTFHTVTVTKSYKDEQGDWHEVTNFGRDDLPSVELATRKAFEYIHLKAEVKQQRNSETSFVDRVTGANDNSELELA